METDMQLRIQNRIRLTIAEFDAHVEGLSDDAIYELVDGEIVMMTNPNQRHEQIASNIAWALKGVMDPRGCRTYQGGMRVQLSDSMDGTDKTKPDVVVRCGPTTLDRERRNYITDPVVVVEVLSPSTMDVDRGAKLDFYKQVPTVMHIAIVYQDQMRIEDWRRTPEGWQRDVLTKGDEMLAFGHVSFKMQVAQAYFDIGFD
jgi:Uma2 family endonuclease